MVELAVTIMLVIPVPRKIRNAMARTVGRLNLGERLSTVGYFVAMVLFAALVESITSVRNIEERQRMEHQQTLHGAGSSMEHDRIFHDMARQRKFRSERNMYLAGFALTLVFVIVRICKLMQESVEHEEEVDRLTNATTTEQAPLNNTDGVEMTTVKSKTEKKKD